MKSEWEKECERFLFDFGRQVLGKDTGGMIVKLKQKFGISSAWNEIKYAAAKSDPREYIGAVLAAHSETKQSISDEEYSRLKAEYDAKVARTA